MCKGVCPLCTRKRRMIPSLATLINREDKDLNLHNNLTLVYGAFPSYLP